MTRLNLNLSLRGKLHNICKHTLIPFLLIYCVQIAHNLKKHVIQSSHTVTGYDENSQIFFITLLSCNGKQSLPDSLPQMSLLETLCLDS